MKILGYVALVVREYDEAIAYTDMLGFRLVEDTVLSDEKRWVLVAPPGSHGTSLLLARAATPEQASRIGNQTGGRVFLFLHTDDFWRDYSQMTSRQLKFIRPASEESYGTVADFEDLYGNRWDLLQLKEKAGGLALGRHFARRSSTGTSMLWRTRVTVVPRKKSASNRCPWVLMATRSHPLCRTHLMISSAGSP